MLEDLEIAWNSSLEIPSTTVGILAAEASVERSVEIYRHALLRQFVAHEGRASDQLRVSMLGKPAMELFARKFHPEWFEGEPMTRRLHQLFTDGDVFEATIQFHLRALGYTILETQRAVEWNGVTGHTDAIVRTPEGEDILLEFKTANAYRFAGYTKLGALVPCPYATQLAIYSAATNLPSAWVFYNKDTSDLKVVPFKPDVYAHYLDRAAELIEMYQGIQTWEQVFDHVAAPEPIPERYKNAQTGRYLIPSDMNKALAAQVYSCVPDVNGYGKETTYVVGYTMPWGIEPL